MKFEEAIRKLKDGYKIKPKHWSNDSYIYLKGDDIKFNNGNTWQVFVDDILDDWETIGETDKGEFWEWCRNNKGFDYCDKTKQPIVFIKAFEDYLTSQNRRSTQ